MAFRLNPLRLSSDNSRLSRPSLQNSLDTPASLPNQNELVQLNYVRQPLLPKKTKSQSVMKFQQTFGEFEQFDDQHLYLQQLFDDGEDIKGNRPMNLSRDQNFQGWIERFYERSPVFLPSQPLILVWKAVMAGLILLFFFVIPITITYGQEVWALIHSAAKESVTLVTFVFLICDIIIEFQTAYYLHGNFIVDKRLIANNYFRTYFFPDMIATVAFGTISIVPHTDPFDWFLIFFYLKYPSLLKIDYQFEEFTLLHRSLRTIYNFGKIIILLQFCFLIFACVFYSIGRRSVSVGYNSWLLNDGNFGVILELETGFQFFFSYYFALGTMTTTMGYGDITPLNVFECTWCLGGIIFAVFIFQVNVNSLFKIMEEYNQFPLKIYRQRVAINRFMRSKNVPQPVQERVRRFLNENWYEEGNRDTFLEQSIITTLPPEIKEDLLFNSYGMFLQSIPMFSQNFSQNFLKMLALNVEEVNYSQGDVIFTDRQQQQDDYSFYYIQSGQILIHTYCSSGQPYYLKMLGPLESFGEWSFITGFERTACAQAVAYSNIYKVSRKVFTDALNQFPEDFEIFSLLKDKLVFNRDCHIIMRQCWTCGSYNHYSTSCDVTHYIPDMNLYEIKQSAVQERQRYDRSTRERWHTIPNQKLLTYKFKRTKFATKVNKIVNDKQKVEQSEIKQQQMPSFNLKDYRIHQELKEIDRPYQFKYYFPKCNYIEMNAFKNYTKISKLALGRQSMYPLTRTSIIYRKTP